MAYRVPPSDLPVAAVVIGAQLPDLIDKRLSSGGGVFQTGYVLGHSALVTENRRERLTLQRGEDVKFDTALWPGVVDPPYQQGPGLARGLVYVTDLSDSPQAADSLSLVGAYLLVPAIAVAVWIADGTPGTTVFSWISGRFGPW